MRAPRPPSLDRVDIRYLLHYTKGRDRGEARLKLYPQHETIPRTCIRAPAGDPYRRLKGNIPARYTRMSLAGGLSS